MLAGHKHDDYCVDMNTQALPHGTQQQSAGQEGRTTPWDLVKVTGSQASPTST